MLVKRTAIVVSVFCLFFVFALTSRSVTFRADSPIILPPYYGPELASGVGGRIIVKLDFDEGKVQSVKIISSDLVSRNDYIPNYPRTRQLFEEKVAGVVRQWKTIVMSPFSMNVVFEFVIDPKLQTDVRDYSLEYAGNPDIPTKVILKGPVTAWPR